MRIAFLNLYSGTNERGAESFAHTLGLLLIGKGYHVDFYTGRQAGVEVVQPEHNVRNPLKRLFLDPASLSVLVFTWKILPQLWRRKYTWIVPMNGFWQLLICKVVSFFRGSKILITGHSGPGWDERWNLYLKPDIFVATTEPTARWAKRTCPWTKVVTVPYGIDVDTFAKAKPVEVNLERPIILCIAAAVEYKRVDLAIKAVAKLKKSSLLHLGTGPLLPQLKELGEKLLGKRFLNMAVSYGEMPGYYAACDLVTLPTSPQENSPISFQEALVARKVTVTTDAPRSRWILGKGGIFVDPTDIGAYAKALRQGLDFKDKKAIASQAQKYSWERIIKEYEKLFSAGLRQG